MEVVLDKITMPSADSHVVRPRLVKILRSSLDSCTSTVITGRAGVGKTSLVADFGRTCGRPVSWYKVDASDADLSIFLTYLVASIRTERGSFNLDPQTLLRERADCNPETLADCFAYQLLETNGNALLVVIEDLHLVSDAVGVNLPRQIVALAACGHSPASHFSDHIACSPMAHAFEADLGGDRRGSAHFHTAGSE